MVKVKSGMVSVEIQEMHLVCRDRKWTAQEAMERQLFIFSAGLSDV